MVQDGDLAAAGELDDGVDVEVELGRLVVIGEHGVPEDGQRAQRSVGKYDVTAQVVPGTPVAEANEAPNAGRLRVVRPAQWHRIGQHSSERALSTGPGSITSRQATPAGQTRGAGRAPVSMTSRL